MTETSKPKETTLRHSGLGIASFVISFVVGVSYIITFAVAALLVAQDSSAFNDENSIEAMVLGLVIIAIGLINLIGIGLGIAGTAHKKRKKILGILGLVFNACLLLCVVLLIGIGVTA